MPFEARTVRGLQGPACFAIRMVNFYHVCAFRSVECKTHAVFMQLLRAFTIVLASATP